MTTRDLIEETYIALSANKVRSSLTVLGIVIGIGSVIAMIAIGSGAQNSVTSRIESMGSNLVMVAPGMQRGVGMTVSSGRGTARTLTQDDANAITEEISLARAVAPENSGRYQVTAKGTNTNTSIVGVTAIYPEVRNVGVDDGSFITEQHDEKRAKVAVLGPTVVADLFPDATESVVGSTIRIKGMEFKVIGVTTAKGGTGFGSQDDMIYIPLSSAQRYLAGSSYVTQISVQAENAEYMTEIKEEITTLLLARHKIADAALADFTVINQADIVETASSVTETFTMLLAAVAAISLLVGGIGIMNMMLTTVTERTKEIGLRKSIGAKERDISAQFLTEAVVLTVLGGVLGIVLGFSVAYAMTTFGGITATVELSSVLLAVGVSALIGIVFGYYPARRAARLSPIDALRFE
jgi:putative ABC transport system permease protein